MDWLVIKNLYAYQGRIEVLHNINFTIEQGDFILILGANNAGKTTLLRSLVRIVKTKGNIIFQGRKINKKSINEVVRLGIAYIPQREGVFTGLSVQDNLRLGAFASNQPLTSKDWDNIFDIFPMLKNKLYQFAATLSGGEQHILAIARAFMQKPTLLLLDEPSDGLAPTIVEHVFKIIQKMNREQGLTIILVEQNANLAIPFVNYIHLLDSGRIVASGNPDYIQKNDTVLKIYLGR